MPEGCEIHICRTEGFERFRRSVQLQTFQDSNERNFTRGLSRLPEDGDTLIAPKALSIPRTAISHTATPGPPRGLSIPITSCRGTTRDHARAQSAISHARTHVSRKARHCTPCEERFRTLHTHLKVQVLVQPGRVSQLQELCSWELVFVCRIRSKESSSTVSRTKRNALRTRLDRFLLFC